MLFSIIVAVSENQVIGNQGALPWKLSSDLQLFKQRTLHHTVIMGRKTFESISKPLPNRTNIVISRDTSLKIEGCMVVASVQEAFALGEKIEQKEVFIIGGGEIYQQSLERVDKIYLTKVKTHLEGDTFFPELKDEDWVEIAKTFYPKNERNYFDFEVIELARKK